VRAELHTVTTVGTQDGLAGFFIPDNGPNRAGIVTLPATDAGTQVKASAATGAGPQGVGWACPDTGRLLAGLAHRDDGRSRHTTHRSDRDTALLHTASAMSPRTGEFAVMAADAVLCISHFYSHYLTLPSWPNCPIYYMTNREKEQVRTGRPGDGRPKWLQKYEQNLDLVPLCY